MHELKEIFSDLQYICKLVSIRYDMCLLEILLEDTKVVKFV